jgi:hypothetical protein
MTGKAWDYSPDKWMLIEIKGIDPHYRVFGVWYGGYLDGDSWRLNSGIIAVEEDDNYYYFYGNTGSVYRCHKESYGSNTYGWSVAQRMAERSGTTMYLMDEPENIMEMVFTN